MDVAVPKRAAIAAGMSLNGMAVGQMFSGFIVVAN